MISQPSSQFCLDASGSLPPIPRHSDRPKLTRAPSSCTLSSGMSLSPTREADGPKLPHTAEDSDLNESAGRRPVGEEMPSPDVTAPSGLFLGGLGKQNDGEGGHEFRCELAPHVDPYIDLI